MMPITIAPNARAPTITTGQGFILHPALIGSQYQGIWPRHLAKIRVRSRWGEGFMITDLAAIIDKSHRLGVLYELHRMGHTRIQAIENNAAALQRHFEARLEIKDLRHPKLDHRALNRAVNDACYGLERNIT